MLPEICGAHIMMCFPPSVPSLLDEVPSSTKMMFYLSPIIFCMCCHVHWSHNFPNCFTDIINNLGYCRFTFMKSLFTVMCFRVYTPDVLCSFHSFQLGLKKSHVEKIMSSNDAFLMCLVDKTNWGFHNDLPFGVELCDFPIT